MTTYTFSTIARNNDTVANFRLWVQEIQAALAACGMIQTADTGQINSTTATIPGTANTAAGYEIWKLPGPSPLFAKFEYGLGGSSPRSSMWITVGEGSNGSGTLTGNVSDRWQNTDVNLTSGVNPVPSYFVATNDFFGMVYKIRAQNTNKALFVIAFGKTVDSNGVGNNDGFGVVASSNSISGAIGFQSVRRATPAFKSVTFSTLVFHVPHAPASSLYNGNQVCFPAWLGIPDMKLFPWLAAAHILEAPSESTFTTAFVVGASHTYIQMGSNLQTSNAWGANWGLSMIWE